MRCADLTDAANIATLQSVNNDWSTAMTSLLSFDNIAAFFREMIEAQLKPLPGAADRQFLEDESDEDRISEREAEYFYWGLFPVY